MAAARVLRPPLRAATYRDAVRAARSHRHARRRSDRLDKSDVGLADGVLTVRDAKFGRSRLVPLHPTVPARCGATRPAVTGSAPARQRPGSSSPPPARLLRTSGADRTFARSPTALGLRTAGRRPRIHDLRHTFAVRKLLDWHRDGDDLQARMPVLSTYLGHVSPAGTYWYLTAVPELLALAAATPGPRPGARP